MEGALDLAVGAGHTAAGVGVVGAAQLGDVAIGVLDDFLTLDDVCALEAYLAAGGEAEEFLGRVFHEVLALDVELAAEGHRVCTRAGLLGIVVHLDGLDAVFGIVGEHDLYGIHHGHHAGGDAVEVVAHGVLEQAHRVEGLILGVADGVDEVAYRGGGVAAAAQARDGGHAGIVPAGHQTLLDQREQLALAHHGVGEVEAVELYLAGAVALVGQLVDKVVVERAVRHKLQRAYRVGHPLEVVALAVGKVIHGVDFPGGAGAVVGVIDDAVHDGIAEVHVARRHVDFGAQHARALGKLAGVHAHEEVEILLGRAVAVGRRLAGLGRGTLLRGNLLGALVVDICLALLDEAHGQVKELREIVGGVVLAVGPVEAEPVDVFLDGVDILHILLDRIGIVEAQVASAAKLLGHTEIHAYGLGMADMEVSVGLGRETRVEATAVFAGAQVGIHFLFYKTEPAGQLFGIFDFGHCCDIFGAKLAKIPDSSRVGDSLLSKANQNL